MEELEKKLGVMLDNRAGASGPDALGQAVDAVAGDVNLQYQLRRYRLIGETLRNELPSAIDPGFHASVMAKLAEAKSRPSRAARAEPAEPKSGFAWLTRPLAGLAVAAAVAVVTVSLWQPLERVVPGGDEVAKNDPLEHAQPEQPQIAVKAQVASPGTRWKVDSPVLQQKLNAYLVNHTEYASSMQGIIPQARVAGFDSEP